MTGIDRAIWLLAISQTIFWAGLYYSFPALLLHFESGLGWSKTDLTICFTAAIAASALASPLAGRLIDHGFGPYALAGAGLAGGLIMAGLSFVDTYPLFLLGWVAIGITLSACLYEPCFALVTRARGAAAKRGITLITLVAGFASTLSFPLAHAMANAGGWQTAAFGFAVLVCLVGVPLALIGGRMIEAERSDPQPSAEQSETTVPTRGFLSRPPFWLLAFAFSLMALNHGIVVNHLLPLLDERGLEPTTAVLAASMIGPMQVSGRLAMMVLERHVTSHAITIASFAAVSVASMFLLGSGAIPVMLVGYVILQGSGYGVTSIMKPVVSREILGERNFGALTGAMAVPYLAAFAFAPYAGSLLWEIGGYGLAIWTAFSATAIGLLLYLAASRWR